ncbi:MAG: hypothetical protein MUP76_10985, partial [Acidimicrobiia bacterium]|nr:hypothetical protein [Acidimicrobiia bacterium]
ALSNMGIEVIEAGCDLTLAAEVTGSRTSARYKDNESGQTRTCWGGQRATGTVSLSSDEGLLAEWQVDRNDPPPDSIRGCPDAESPIRSEYWSGPVMGALIDIFGTPAAVMATVEDVPLGPAARDTMFNQLNSAQDAGEVLAAGLAHPNKNVRLEVSYLIMSWAESFVEATPPYAEQIWSTIPHLIACGARGGFDDAFDCRNADSALTRMLFRTLSQDDLPEGFDPEDPSDWWAVWETNPTP